MEYKKISIIYRDEVIDIWNKEFGSIYPLTIELVQRNIFECKNVEENGSFFVVDNNKLIGFIISKTWKENFFVEGYQDFGWISLVFVSKEYRNLGIGSNLLTSVTDFMKRSGKKTLILGKDPNNFFPGIPKEFKEYYLWFEKRGFVLQRDTYDLLKIVDNKTNLCQIGNIPYQVQFMSANTFDETIKFMQKNFPGRWTFELHDYINRGGNGKEYIIMMNNKKVIGFCRINDYDTKIINYNMTWKALFKHSGGIGPLGIDSGYRNQNLGYYIVAYGVNELIKRNVDAIVIDWTSLIDFYKKFGFYVWKTYKYAQKAIETK